MLGGRFDEHPWGISEATVIVEDRDLADLAAPAGVLRGDRRALSAEGLLAERRPRPGAARSASKLDLKAPLVHRADRDFAVAYTKSYGKGRVFYSTLGHPRELWDSGGCSRCTSKP